MLNKENKTDLRMIIGKYKTKFHFIDAYVAKGNYK